MGKISFAIISVLISLPAFAHVESSTTYSNLIQEFQQQFADVIPGRKIVIMDRDWIQLNVIDRTEGGEIREEVDAIYSDVSTQFIRRHTKAELSQNSKIILGAFQKQGAAHAILFHGDDLKSDTIQELCTVTGHHADKDADFQTRILSGLSENLVKADGKMEIPVSSRMTLEELNLYTDYHELGHCLDEVYLPALFRKWGDSVETEAITLRHKSEIFAEIFATLYLAKLGHRNFVDRRKNIRIVGTINHGTSAAHLATDEFPEYSTGYIYALHDALDAAKKWLSNNNAEQFSLRDLLEAAKAITENHAISPMHQHSVGYLLSNKLTTPAWESMSKDIDMIQVKYDYAMKTLDALVKGLGEFFRLSGERAQQTAYRMVHSHPKHVGELSRRARTYEQQEKSYNDSVIQSEVARLKPKLQSNTVIEIIQTAKEEFRARLESENPEEVRYVRQALHHIPQIANQLKKIN